MEITNRNIQILIKDDKIVERHENFEFPTKYLKNGGTFDLKN